MLTGQQCPAGKLHGDLGTADGLYHHFYLGVILNNGEILDKAVSVRTVGKVPDIQNVFHINFFAQLGGDALSIDACNLCQTGTQGTMTHNCNFCHDVFSFSQPARISNFTTPSSAPTSESSCSRDSSISEVSAEMVTAAQPLVGIDWLMVRCEQPRMYRR